MPESTFVVGTDGSTLGDLATHLETRVGIDTSATTTPAPGVSVVDGALVVTSNIGEANAVELDAGAISNVTNPSGSPFLFAVTTPAAGEAVTTSFNVYDSLGNPVEVRLRMAMESKGESGTTWRFQAESPDDSDASPFLGSGTVSFDHTGRFLAAAGTTLSIDRAGSGATSPLLVDLSFDNVTGHASTGGESRLIMDEQNGREAGFLSGYRVETDGTIVATYSNEQEKTLGQVALATFPTEEGLIAMSENLFKVGPASGDPTIQAGESGVAGSVVQGALEESNVEIAREFINLITAQTGISSASRVVRVADDLLQELLLMAR